MKNVNEKKKKFIVPNLTGIWNYYHSHIWCSLATAILCCVLILLFVILFYLKKEYYNYLLDTTYNTEQQLLESVNKNMEKQLDDYINIGTSICVDEEYIEKTNSYLDSEERGNAQSNLIVTSLLRDTAGTSDLIISIAVANKERVLYQHDKNRYVSIEKQALWEDKQCVEQIFNEVYTKAKNNIIPRYYIINNGNIKENNKYLHLAFPIKNGTTYNDIKGIFIISFDMNPFFQLLKQLNEDQKYFIQGYIEDAQGNIILHTDSNEVIGKNVENFIKENNLTDIARPIGEYGWKVHASVDETALQEQVDATYQKNIYVYIVAIVIICLILFWEIHHILRPVNMLMSSVEKVRDEQDYELINIGRGSNEIWKLAEAYNGMLNTISKANENIKNKHQQIIETIKMQQMAERDALESQINAHFICNTLNVINYEAMANGDDKVSILLKKLSSILRYTFDQRHQNVNICQEIDWIEQYLFLQRERMDYMFDYKITFDADYENWPCRKLMFQPFVENAILHGFVGMKQKGFINIIGEGYKEFLKIVIEDNGNGMDASMCKIIQQALDQPSLSRQSGIGISNAVARMKMFFGDELRVSVKSEIGKGARFTFILPMVNISGKDEE